MQAQVRLHVQVQVQAQVQMQAQRQRRRRAGRAGWSDQPVKAQPSPKPHLETSALP